MFRLLSLLMCIVQNIFLTYSFLLQVHVWIFMKMNEWSLKIGFRWGGCPLLTMIGHCALHRGMRVVQPVIADYFTNAGNIFFQTGTFSQQNIGLSYIQMELPGKQCILLLVCWVINRYTYNVFLVYLDNLCSLENLVHLCYLCALYLIHSWHFIFLSR